MSREMKTLEGDIDKFSIVYIKIGDRVPQVTAPVVLHTVSTVTNLKLVWLFISIAH